MAESKENDNTEKDDKKEVKEIKQEAKKEEKSDNKNDDTNDNDTDDGKGKVLILGGCGFIGRHLIKYFLGTKKFKMIYVSDKLIPQTSYMTKDQIKMFKNDNVKLIQSDLSKDIHIKKVFKYNVQYIINLCGETRFGQTENDYKLKCLIAAQKCIKAALKMKTLVKWIEISTAQVYSPQKKPVNENGKIEPFTNIAKYRYKVEEELKKTKLPYLILRPSIVYGPGDKSGITPRLICAICYKNAKQKMTFLWTPNLAINTVHVYDLCNAIFLVMNKGKIKSIYNISDEGNTTQGSLNTVLESVFKIKCDFYGSVFNNLAKKMMSMAASTANDTHVPMWSDVQKTYNITQTPLSPYMDQEILTKNYLCIDGKKICKELGFKYKYKKINDKLIWEILDEYAQQKYIPDVKKMK